MRKIDFNKPIMNLDNVPLKKDDKVLTMKEIITNALCLSRPTNPDDAKKQLALAKLIYKNNGQVEINDENFELIKVAITDGSLSALVSGQITEYLDNIKPIAPRRR
jgi:hypothetical protein